MPLFQRSALKEGVSPREAFGWALFDAANSGYSTVVLTAVFNAYFVSKVCGDASWATFLWSCAVGAANALSMVLMPAIGRMADLTATKKKWLVAATMLCVSATALLALSGPGTYVLSVTMLILSYIGYNVGESLNSAFLPEIARPEAVGKVSGWGWSLGYVGGLFTLALCLTVVLVGESFSDAAAHAVKMQVEEGLTFVHPFDDPYVIAGQGTIGMEILRQYQPSDGTRPDAIFVQIGGGGLAAGVATYIKAIYPEIKVFGVETVDSDAMDRSFKAGENIALDDVGLFSDGTAVKRVGDETLRLCRENLDGIVLVNSDEICAAIKDVFEDTRSIVEPSGALSLAGLKAWARREGVTNKTLVAITSGANMNFDRLRFVCERAEFGEDREAVFAVTIPEERGSFRRLCGLLGNRAVTEFNYRMSDNTDAYIFVGVQTTNANDVEEIEKALKTEGFPALNLSHDELAKLHLRHMVGGHSKLAVNEKLYRFEFPERPGALMKFLTSLAPQWNISLFHYRNNGADFGRVFAGIQVPPQDNELFEQFLKTLGYRYWDETDNPACRFFLS